MNYAVLIQEILKDYVLHPWGFHGLAHWARVTENGLKLAEQTGADRDVIALFGIFHDSRRENDGYDIEHGPRGALLAQEFRGKHFELSDAKFELLYRACELHTIGRHDPDVTVLTCWDSDRLDLGRIGVVPNPKYLGTAAARDPKMIAWAHARARREMVPDLTRTVWGVMP